MDTRQSIIDKARSVRDEANSSSNPDLAACVIALAELVDCLATRIDQLEDEVGREP